MVSWAQKSPEEERWNSITHALGLGFFLILSLSSVTTIQKIYSLTVCMTMFLSTMYHGVESQKNKIKFRRLDMMSIHVLISSTGFCYVYRFDGGFFDCAPLLLVGLCSSGYVYIKYGQPFFEKISVPLYVLSGMICLVSVLVVNGEPSGEMAYFASGVAVYLMGLIFYLRDYKKWYHTLWHLFVLAGSLMHFAGLGTI